MLAFRTGKATVEAMQNSLLSYCRKTVIFPAQVKKIRTTVNMIFQTAFFNNRTAGEVHKLQAQFVNESSLCTPLPLAALLEAYIIIMKCNNSC